MDKKEKWVCVLWHCANCGALVRGLKSNRGGFKCECQECHTTMVRMIKNARHDVLDIYAPPGMTQIGCR